MKYVEVRMNLSGERVICPIFKTHKKHAESRWPYPRRYFLAGLSNYCFLVFAIAFNGAVAAFFLEAAFGFITAKSSTSFHRTGTAYVVALSDGFRQGFI